MDQKKKKFRFETFSVFIFEIYRNNFNRKRGGITVFPFKIPSTEKIFGIKRALSTPYITRIQYHFYFPSLSQFYQ